MTSRRPSMQARARARTHARIRHMHAVYARSSAIAHAVHCAPAVRELRRARRVRMLAVATPAVRRTAAMRRCSWRPRQQPPHQPAGGSLHVRSLSSGRTSPALTPPPPPLRRPPAASKPEMTMVDRLLRQRILAHGPVSVSDFMQEVLTAPIGGYYTEATATDDQPATSAADVGVFGKRGDFVTAPEISQLFGELLGLWCIGLWQSAGSPKTVQLVELGPGRGKMMSDILRTSKHFPAFNGALSVSMVEASPTRAL
jgi:hypothetical protein